MDNTTNMYFISQYSKDNKTFGASFEITTVRKKKKVTTT